MCLTKLDMGKHTPVTLPEKRKQPAGVVSLSALIGYAYVEVRPAYTNYKQSFGNADLELRALILINAVAGIKRNGVKNLSSKRSKWHQRNASGCTRQVNR